MKLSKQEEKELLQVYNIWWDSYLNGDIKTYNAYLDEDFRFVGSTGGEEFLDRKDTTAFFEATADQLAGKAKLENIDRTMEAFEGMVLFTDLADAYILDGTKWVYYARFRFTSLLRKTPKGWRFFYQHFSTPDLMADEGETLGIDKVTAENLELRNAIKRRTAELELKNRELEIESALERIRAQVTAMSQSSDLLDIVVTMRTEFVKLGHEAHYFWHMRWLPEKYEKAMTSGDGTRIGFVMQLPRHIHGDIPLLANWEKSNDATVVYTMNVEEAIAYVDKMVNLGDFQSIDPQAPTHDDIRHINGLTFIMARTSHGEIGYSLPGVVKSPLKEDLDLLVRFAGAFDLAHKRFEDLRKSEQQARETKIELGLERVRARAMAMQDSSELQELIHTVHKEFRRLDLPITGGVFVAINNELRKEINCWGSGETTAYAERIHLPFLNSRIYTEFISKVNEGPGFFTEMFSNQLKKKFFNYLFRQGPYLNTSEAHQKEVMNRAGGYVRSCTVSKKTSMFMINHHGQEFSKDDNEILIRFGKVFEQTYTRFLDLQKAEEQTRKTQIELALERVRARTMAMQQSEELGDVATVLFKELNELVENLWTCGFVLCEKDREEDEWWLSTEEGFIPPLQLPNIGDVTHHNIYQAWKNGATYHTEQLEGDALQEHYDWLMTIPKAKEFFDDMLASGLEMPSWQKLHCAYFSYGYLVMITRVPCPEEEIFKRFAQVFDQTYTRFLDLQKAEAQARESQINLAVERIRARALAMYNSSELLAVVTLLRDEMLGLKISGVAAATIYLEEDDGKIRMTDLTSIEELEGGFKKTLDIKFNLNETDPNLFLRKIWECSDDFFLVWQRKDDLPITLKWLQEYDASYAEEVDNFFRNIEWEYVVHPVVQLNNGRMTVDILDQEPPQELESIMKKMASAFDLTYKRFLDLQKAEAQSREAEIELALERVRARTMAMQHSDELLEVASVMFQQVNSLGVSQWNCGFNIWEKGDKEFTYYPGSPDGKIIPFSCKIPLNEHPVFRRFEASKKRGEELLIYEKKGKEQKEHYDYMLSLPGVGDFLRTMMDANFELPSYQIDHIANFAYGNLLFITYEPFPEMHDVFIRFAKVFEQTYTRFLDLQKAEAQAKEAQIEAAMERIRSKSMSMSSSKDIGDTVATLFDELVKIGHSKTARTGIGIFDDSKYIKLWSAITDTDEEAVVRTGQFDMSLSPSNRKVKNAWKRGDKDFYFEMKGPELIKYYKAINESPDYDLEVDLKSLPEKEYRYQCYFKYGLFYAIDRVDISEETKIIFTKFSQVFEQIYTRFMDLQRAEAQTREAEIETALERVRSRSMGMHHSDELKDVIKVIFDQMTHLSINAEHAGIVVDYEPKKDFHFWVAETQDIPARITVPYLDLVWDRQFTEAKKKGKDFFKTQLDFEEKNSFYKELLPHIKGLTKKALDFYFTCPGLAASTVIQKDIGLYIENFSGIPYTDEENSILMRFGQVFQQTYTRFLDLQKAEDQAREAQIETALEKVRSRTMAMQHSDELGDTAELLFQQVKELGIETWTTGFNIWQNGNKSFIDWVSLKDGFIEPYEVNCEAHPFFSEISAARQNGEDFHVFELEGEYLEEIYQIMSGMTKLSFDKINESLMSLPSRQINHYVFGKEVSLMFITYEPCPEAWDVFKRFGKVFEQTYTRFLDLQKAEAQARESQIEAALEKVRSQSLAMQKSEQLPETSKVLFEQFESLGKVPDRIGIIIFNEEAKEFELWGTDQIGSELNHSFVGSLEEPTVMVKMHKAWKEGKDSNIIDLSGHDLKDWIKYNRKNVELPVDVSRIKGRRVQQAAFFSQGMFLFTSNEPEGEETMSLLVRFAKVFDQAYTRFLNLQKAEAQTREAQIEAALEKVRSRSNGMQSSEELREVIQIIHDQLIHLNFQIDAAGFTLDYHQNNDWNTWIANKSESLPSLMFFPYIDHPQFNYYRSAKEKGLDFLANTLSFEEKNSIFRYMFGFMGDYPQEEKDEVLRKPGLAISQAFMKNISLWIYNLDAIPYSDEDNNTLMRFAKVFEQTYTRFLDLQKAEAQAREAQIEMALERVRSRTMAMHNSSELADTAAVLFQQLKELGVDHDRTNIGIVDEANRKINFWLTTQKGNLVDKTFPASIDESNSLKAIYKGYKEKRKSIIVEQKGAELKRWISFITNKLGIPYTPPTRNERRFQNVGYISQGMLIATSTNSLNEESVRILERFAAVFEQTYTRFLDLQKVEAQAMEAQIEAALEKVRSRSLAMQKPEELQEVVAVVAEKLQELGVIFDAGGVILSTYFPDSKDVMHWIAVDDFSSSGSYFVPYFDNPIFNDAWDSKIKGDAYFSKEFTVKAKNEFFKHAFKNSDYRHFPDDYKQHVLQADKHNLSAAWSKNSAIIIPSLTGAIPSESDAEIMKRFAKVFEQAYIRFMDLQKAEAQAREAQIEAALERTRNQSMQMQHSDEIKDLSKIFHEQLLVLKIPSEFSYVWLPEEDKHEHMFWATWSETTKKVTSTKSKSVVYPLDKSEPYTAACYKAWASKEPIHITKVSTEETKDFFTEWKELLKGAKKLKARYFPEGIYIADAYMKYGCFGINIRRALQNDEADVLHRFAIEFERAYTRFLDLQKAEAQAREAQIEAALERVRSKTMAMHNSQDVGKTVVTFFDEVMKLGLNKGIRCGIGILEDREKMETWSATSYPNGDVDLQVGLLDMKRHPLIKGLEAAWKNKEDGYSGKLVGEDVVRYYEQLIEEPDYPFHVDLENLEDIEYHRSFFFSSGIIFTFTKTPLSEEAALVLNRFASVFGQTYRRFLDLQKAEAQAREAEIELALERVRNRAMTMLTSLELGDLIITVFKELQGLDMTLTRCLLWIFNQDDQSATAWMTNSEDPDHADHYHVPYHDHPAYKNYLKSWKSQVAEWEYTLKGKNKDRWDEMLVEEFFKTLPRKVKNAMKSPEKVILSGSFNKFGLIQTAGLEPLSSENKTILNRFSQVFEQNYKRFLDLQKAEKQAQEAQIEAALEKVRARTMAMQSSSELVEAANLLFNQVRDLGINAWSAGYNILSEDKTQSRCWMSSEDELQDPFPLYFTEESSFIEMGEFLKSDKTFFVQELGGKALKQHYDYMISIPELEDTFNHIKSVGLTLPEYQINHLCKFKQGFLLFITYEKSPEAHDVFKRFTKVFEQTYTRFLDLQKAEVQSKEAQIELALERVRASSMAMHQSEQLPETAEVLFEQFDLLGIIPDRISIAVYNESKRIFELWATDQAGALVDHGHHFSIDEPTCMAKTYKAWKQGEQTFVVDLQGKELEDWVQYVKEDTKMDIDASQFKGRRVQHSAFFSHGYLMLSSHVPISDDMMQLLVRFSKVFQQSYTRFLDLTKAEKQAREAIKRASVDRVRAEIASMRTATDLNRITPLVWNELTTLDVPFIRCGVFIMDEEQQEVQTHLSTPDGKALASFQLSFDDTEPLDQLLPHWRKKEMYTDHWDKKAFIESTKILMQKGAISSKETYLTKNQPNNLHLHFLPFLQGMLYVGSEVPLSEDELSLVQNLAEAFSSAYARYEDFNKLELANKKIEKTLVDLKQAQSQLVQSEKMASLGELTAGIAHEIQNPLNFVNNFSEVSHELLIEMKEELDNGDLEEVREITTDIEQNLEKINHHGQRASDIVKGMLQHSRSSSGTKELTDINALADEYLRLAYHGLRAKDKTFNAKMETEFDEKLDKIEVIPQDIGRVILNLITNAFYAVDQKKKQVNGDFEPKVSISTKKIKGGLEIKVGDNGNGIPENVLEKIFQPFFTTKPTGQGTGLGLSLSYDIIKAHGGELKVTTEKGKGTEFNMILPK